MANWSHGTSNPLINFKTFVYFGWGKKLMNILPITSRAFYMQLWCTSLLFFMSFTKNQWTLFTHRRWKFTRSLRILASIIYGFQICFPSYMLVLLRYLRTLEEDAESFWRFNICSLSLFGRIVELTLLFTRLPFIDSLFTFGKLVPVFTIFITSFLTPKKPFLFLWVLVFCLTLQILPIALYHNLEI